MKAPRQTISKAIREAVLAEFNHRCALCGADRPHLHHIDENPANSTADNLLPLCPNHHLTDQHDPTRQVDPLLLASFRKYKDPQMLSPQFAPIFRRFKLLLERSPAVTFEELAAHASDLTRFVERLSMGAYYERKLRELLDWSYPSNYSSTERAAVMRRHLTDYNEKLAQVLPSVLELLVEQLRYQQWPRVVA